VLYRSTRPPEASAPPHLTLWLTLAGIVLAAIFVWLGTRAGATAAATVFAAWALLCGLLGSILTALWTVTDHRFAYANENLLVFNPLWLVLVPLLPMYLIRGGAPRATRGIVFVLACLSALALALHAVLLSRQMNLAVIGLALPTTLALAYVTATRSRMPRRPGGKQRRARRRVY
jgi:hypothetical protein